MSEPIWLINGKIATDGETIQQCPDCPEGCVPPQPMPSDCIPDSGCTTSNWPLCFELIVPEGMIGHGCNDCPTDSYTGTFILKNKAAYPSTWGGYGPHADDECIWVGPPKLLCDNQTRASYFLKRLGGSDFLRLYMDDDGGGGNAKTYYQIDATTLGNDCLNQSVTLPLVYYTYSACHWAGPTPPLAALASSLTIEPIPCP